MPAYISNGSPIERYSRLHLARFPVGRGEDVISFPEAPEARILASPLAQILFDIQGFKTLEEHIEERVRKLSGFQRVVKPLAKASLRNVFLEFAKEGMITPLSQFLDQCRLWAGPQEPPPPISTLSLVTCERVELLKRALLSYVNNGRQFERKPYFVVMDDSRTPQIAEQYRQELKGLGMAHQVTILYAGREEKKRFAEALTAKGVPPKVVRFALFGVPQCGTTYGANCNAVLLHTVGELFFNADDDTIADIGSFPGLENGLELGRGYGPEEIRFYSDPHAAEESASRESQDLLALHEQYLGRDVRQCLAKLDHSGFLGLDRLDPWGLTMLLQHRSTVAMTSSALLGDCGMTYPQPYLFLEGESRRRLLQSFDTYRHLESRQVALGVRRVTLDDANGFLFHAAAYDNRELLPPFFPVMRGSEFIFGQVLRLIGDGTWFARLPWLVRHDPPMRRKFSSSQFSLVPTRLVECFGALLETAGPVRFSQVYPGAQAVIHALGNHLIACGRLPQPEFQDLLRTSARRRWVRTIETVEKLLKKYGATPDFWAHDLRRYLQALRESLKGGQPPVPTDLAEANPKEALALFQRMTEDYGHLLVH